MRRQSAKHLIAFLMRIVMPFITSNIIWWPMTSSNRPVVRGHLQLCWCSKRTSLFYSAWITGDSTLCQTWMCIPCPSGRYHRQTWFGKICHNPGTYEVLLAGACRCRLVCEDSLHNFVWPLPVLHYAIRLERRACNFSADDG